MNGLTLFWKIEEIIIKCVNRNCIGEKGPCWKAEHIDLAASVEPGGLQIYGEMPEEMWESWYSELKEKLTAALGYEIGEPEDRYGFKYFN